MPSSPAVRTTARTDLTPSPCPATRGSPRLVAQRPLPSMMTATCRGSGRAQDALPEIVLVERRQL